jgi:hypothetical protein
MKREIKALASQLVHDHLEDMLDEDALVIRLEVRNTYLEEEEFNLLLQEIQKIIDRLK